VRERGHRWRPGDFVKRRFRPTVVTQTVRGDADVEVHGRTGHACSYRRVEGIERRCEVAFLEGDSARVEQLRSAVGGMSVWTDDRAGRGYQEYA